MEEKKKIRSQKKITPPSKKQNFLFISASGSTPIVPRNSYNSLFSDVTQSANNIFHMFNRESNEENTLLIKDQL